jgi:hypothetical protein
MACSKRCWQQTASFTAIENPPGKTIAPDFEKGKSGAKFF